MRDVNATANRATLSRLTVNYYQHVFPPHKNDFRLNLQCDGADTCHCRHIC